MGEGEQEPGEEDRVMMCWLPIFDLQGESDLFEMIFTGLEKPKELPGKRI
ncbi:MAG: hypothetical protein KO173_01675 [Methanoregulaceae archaeon]|jgi:hypothetical protein|nr:hypothetical protein [Methanoregulaceae archaeon]HRX32883.1 hypothetical protein [Methanoregulaceae archaeon]